MKKDSKTGSRDSPAEAYRRGLQRELEAHGPLAFGGKVDPEDESVIMSHHIDEAFHIARRLAAGKAVLFVSSERSDYRLNAQSYLRTAALLRLASMLGSTGPGEDSALAAAADACVEIINTLRLHS